MTFARRRLAVSALAILALALVPALAAADPGGATEFAKARAEGWLWSYLPVFGAGLGTSLTPCVYPMIPFALGIFGARGQNVSRGRAFLLATMYVAGMGIMYSALGVGVALAGRGFGSILANPWVVFPLVGFYAVLAASMFGAFELNLPSGLQQRLSGVGGKGVGGAFAMGLVGGLTAAPCTGPMLLGLLTYVGTTGNAALGFTLLYTFAIGMGVLFWVLALFAVSLPKSGAWMEGVKSIAGIALLVMGIYFMRPVVPLIEELATPTLSFLLVGVAITVVGLAAGGVHLSFHGSSGEKARKGVGVVLCVAGAAAVMLWILTPKLTPGWRERCQGDQLASADPAAGAGATPVAHKPRCWTDDAVVIAEAKSSKTPVVIDFGADWCLPCKKYETDIFADPAVHRTINADFVALKFDVSKDTETDREAQKRYGAEILPVVIILGRDGQEVRRFHEPLPTTAEFLKALEAAKQ